MCVHRGERALHGPAPIFEKSLLRNPWGIFSGPVFSVLRDRRQLIYLKPTVVNNVSDAKKRSTKDLGGIHASCLLLGVRVCVCIVLLLTHMHTHRKGRLHQEGEVVNFKQKNTPIWYSCLTPKWNIQPKTFHPILKFWKPLRFAWEVQVSATYRALCCVHLSCLPKQPTLILTSSVSQPQHCGPTPRAKSVSVGGEVGGGAVLSVRGCLVAFLASTSRCTPYRSHTNANWLHTWPPLQTHCSSVIILRAGADCTIYSVCSYPILRHSTWAAPYRGLQQGQALSVCTVQNLTSSYPGRLAAAFSCSVLRISLNEDALIKYKKILHRAGE